MWCYPDILHRIYSGITVTRSVCGRAEYFELQIIKNQFRKNCKLTLVILCRIRSIRRENSIYRYKSLCRVVVLGKKNANTNNVSLPPPFTAGLGTGDGRVKGLILFIKIKLKTTLKLFTLCTHIGDRIYSFSLL